jgi:hypothetical protein
MINASCGSQGCCDVRLQRSDTQKAVLIVVNGQPVLIWQRIAAPASS